MNTQHPITVCDASPDDLETIVTFNLLMAKETENIQLDPAVLRPGVDAVLRDATKGRYFVAKKNQHIVGQAMITLEWSDWRNCHWWWIQSVYVAPEARRSGVFRALYDEMMKRSQEEGAQGLRLYVERDNRSAQAVYSALGMKRSHYDLFEFGDE